MKLTEPEVINTLEIVRHSEKWQADGIFKISLILRGCLPGPNAERQSCTLKLDEYGGNKLKICYFPNGSGTSELALLSIIDSGDVSNTFYRTETALVSPTGQRVFLTTVEEYQIAPYKLPMIAKIVPVQNIIPRRHEVIHADNHLLMLFRLWIDTTQADPAEPELEPLTKEEYERIKRKIYDPGFGDVGFNVAGVKMYGHMDIVTRNNGSFQLHLHFAQKNGYYYEFPNTYPQVFEIMLINCYLVDEDVCRLCMDYHDWLR